MEKSDNKNDGALYIFHANLNNYNLMANIYLSTFGVGAKDNSKKMVR